MTGLGKPSPRGSRGSIQPIYSTPNQPFEDVLLRQRTLGQDIIPSPREPKRTESLYTPHKPAQSAALAAASAATGSGGSGGFTGGKSGKLKVRFQISTIRCSFSRQFFTDAPCIDLDFLSFFSILFQF